MVVVIKIRFILVEVLEVVEHSRLCVNNLESPLVFGLSAHTILLDSGCTENDTFLDYMITGKQEIKADDASNLSVVIDVIRFNTTSVGTVAMITPRQTRRHIDMMTMRS